MNRLLSRRIKSYTSLLNKYECLRFKSTQSAKQSSTNSDEKKDQLGDVVNFDGERISVEVQKKLTAKSPIVKDFFIGKVDKEMIPFPEVIERDNMTKLYQEIQNIQTYFNENIDTKTIDRTWCVSPEIIQELKNLGCFGLNIHKDLKGKGYSISESLIASESEEASADIGSILISHRTVVDLLNEFGTENQKQKYLPKLADGSLVATNAIYEAFFAEDQLFNTTAEYDDISNEWTLNGGKSNVVNGIEADLFLVIAQTKHLIKSGEVGKGITLFLVDGSAPGLKKSKEVQSFGFRGSKTCDISLEKVILTNEHVIGPPHEGNVAAQFFLKLQRLRTSLQIFGLMKKIISHMAEFCVQNKQYGVSLQDMEINWKKLAKAITSAYAIESMIYYTAGLMDEFENPDVDVECAILKLFSMETLWSTVKSSLGLLGPSSLLSGQLSEIMLRNTAQAYAGGESVDSLYSYIGLLGLQHAGINIYETVKKQRNPLFHPGHMFSKFLEKSSIETPKTNLHLDHDLHQSLMPAANWLEHSIARLQICTDLLLTRHGNEILQKQIEIHRLAEMAMNIYAMYTSLSRSSRSYCIGLRHSDYEMLLATTFCLNGKDTVKNLAMETLHGEYVNNDRNYKRLSKQILKSRGYFSEHPLKYNF